MWTFLRRSSWLRYFRSWIMPLLNPRRMVTAVPGYVWYVRDWNRYCRLPGAERLRVRDAQPQLHDRTSTTPIDTHYFYANGWAMRRIVNGSAALHVDIGSDIMFVNLLASVVPVAFLDYRPLPARCTGLSCIASDALALPFATESVQSLSTLHVAEHVGLGRYGDPLDPLGTQKAAIELHRVLARGGSLFFALPVGKPRTCFNAHRIHSSEAVRDWFSALDLVEFSGVHDDGTFTQNAPITEFSQDSYACGMFWFKKCNG
jgi:hypothetical protein